VSCRSIGANSGDCIFDVRAGVPNSRSSLLGLLGVTLRISAGGGCAAVGTAVLVCVAAGRCAAACAGLSCPRCGTLRSTVA